MAQQPFDLDDRALLPPFEVLAAERSVLDEQHVMPGLLVGLPSRARSTTARASPSTEALSLATRRSSISAAGVLAVSGSSKRRPRSRSSLVASWARSVRLVGVAVAMDRPSKPTAAEDVKTAPPAHGQGPSVGVPRTSPPISRVSRTGFWQFSWFRTGRLANLRQDRRISASRRRGVPSGPPEKPPRASGGRARTAESSEPLRATGERA